MKSGASNRVKPSFPAGELEGSGAAPLEREWSCERRELKPNGVREIAEKTALVRVERESACTNGRESCSFATRSRTFVHAATVEELRAAIAAVTRALGSGHQRDQILELVRERAALRRELQALQNVGIEIEERIA